MATMRAYQYRVQIWLREPITYMNGDVEITGANYLGFSVSRYPQVSEGMYITEVWSIPVSNIRATMVELIDHERGMQ